MDVGTGKDLSEYGGDVPYHLVDVAPAGYRYNLYEYLRDARAAIAGIRDRGNVPIVVGGTGLYIESLLKGVILPHVPVNDALRSSLSGRPLDELAGILAATKRLHNVTDIDTPARAIRAIEIEKYYLEHPDEAARARNPKPLDALIVGIDMPRDVRRRRIAERMRRRFDSEDMLGEVRRLLAQGISPDDLIYYGLEYKYITLYLIGRMNRSDMEVQLLTAIHQFAKRQMTWFRGMERRGLSIHPLSYDLDPDVFTDAVINLASAHEG